MTSIGSFEAKTHLAALLERAEKGERITITRHGRPVAVLGPVPAQDADAVQGALATLARIRAKAAPGPGWRALRDAGRR